MDTPAKSKLVIWGASGHALVVAYIVRAQGKYEIAGFLDDINTSRWGEEFCGARILGGREQLDRLKDKGIDNVIFGFGDSAARLALSKMIRKRGFHIASGVHPGAIIAPDVTIGSGTVIAPGAVVNPCVKIGQDVIINTSASVDHECVIGDGAHICPGVRLAGRVNVGRGAWVGIGATVVEQVNIGAHALVGAGAAVVSDIPEGVVAYGVPAKIKRKREESDR